MKNIHKKLFAIGLLALFLFVGCTKDFEEMNISPNDPPEVPTAYLLTSAQKGLIAFMWDEWWAGRFGNLYSQYWTQTSYTDESRYKYRDGVNNNYWIYFYAGRDATPDGSLNGGGLMDLQRIIQLNTDEETKEKMSQYGSNANQIAVAKILKSWMYQILTDTWGYVPYEQALQGETIKQPGYTAQDVIYSDLIVKLNEAVSEIDESAKGVTGDIIYKGDMSLWKKFANSLKLRIAIRMSYANTSKAQEVITASWEGAFASNADNAHFDFEAGTPNNNPLNQNQKERTDFAVAKPLMDIMNERNDPRRLFFANYPVNDSGTFIGFPYGMAQDEATPLSNNDFCMPGDCVYAPTAPGMLMNYSEVCFIMAEAAERFGIGGSAQTWYENGIRANMEMWNSFLELSNLNAFYRLDNPDPRPTPVAIHDTTITKYLEEPMVAWGSADALELIGTQKYLALYPQGLQAWFEYTRTGYPNTLLLPGETVEEYNYTFSPLIAIDHSPYRMEYPREEQTLNGTSYQAAVAAQGADNMNTKLWWDKK